MGWNLRAWFKSLFSHPEKLQESKEPLAEALPEETIRVICRKCKKKVVARRVKGRADLYLNDENIILTSPDGSIDIPAGIEIETTHRCNKCGNIGIVTEVRDRNYLINPSDPKQDIT